MSSSFTGDEVAHWRPVCKGAVITRDVIVVRLDFTGFIWKQRNPVDKGVGLVRGRRSCTRDAGGGRCGVILYRDILGWIWRCWQEV